MKVLLIAYACEPNKGSEPGVGWNWAIHLSQYADVTVVTRANNKSSIEGEMIAKSYPNLSFIYFDLPLFAKVKKILPFGTQLYYLIWQYLVIKFLGEEVSKNYDIAHHVTFNSITLPFFIYKLKIRKIIGPLGGGQITASKFLISYRYKILHELLRTLFVKLNKYNYFLRKNIESADRIFCINDDTIKLIPQRFHTKTSKLLETGISDIFLEKDKPIVSRNKSDVKQILWVGILEPRKGLILLLKSLKHIGCEFQLKIIGEGSFSKYYKKIVKQESLSNVVEFLGKIKHTEIINFYKEADIFIFTSIQDSSGNVVLEAMSQGLPIICFDHQGVKEIVDDDCGIKINPLEKNIYIKIAEAIRLLLTDDELRLRLGENAKKKVLEKYNWANKAKRMIEIYKEVLNENPSNS